MRFRYLHKILEELESSYSKLMEEEKPDPLRILTDCYGDLVRFGMTYENLLEKETAQLGDDDTDNAPSEMDDFEVNWNNII